MQSNIGRARPALTTLLRKLDLIRVRHKGAKLFIRFRQRRMIEAIIDTPQRRADDEQ